MAFSGLRVIIVALAALWGIGAAAADAIELYLAPGGLEVVAQDGPPSIFIPVDGTSQSDIVKVATKIWGRPFAHITMEECGAGPIDAVRFENGVDLRFQEDVFVGWATGRDTEARFASGVGQGSAVAELDAIAGSVEVFESTIGHEFAAGNVFGTASGPGTGATIEMLWSGVSCIFR